MNERPKTGCVLGIVPARGGSRGVPRKNVADLGGQPILAWTLNVAREATSLDHLVVSTEDREIAEVAEAYGVQVIRRPSQLSADEAPTAPAVLHALHEVEASTSVQYWAIVTLQPTTPFRRADDIDACVRLLADDPTADAAVSVRELVDAHPARVKQIVTGWLEDYCLPESEGQRRQDFSGAYIRNGAVYATRRQVVLRGSVWGTRQLAYVMPSKRSVNIDEPFDLMVARALHAYGAFNVVPTAHDCPRPDTLPDCEHWSETS